MIQFDKRWRDFSLISLSTDQHELTNQKISTRFVIFLKHDHMLMNKNFDTSWRDILEIQYSIHQICTSDFVSEDWLKKLIYFKSTGHNHIQDFYFAASQIFCGLQYFCISISKFLSENLDKFCRNDYVSVSVISLELFEWDIHFLINQFQTSLINDYLPSLSL